MNQVKVLFASGSDEVIAQTLRDFSKLMPELPLLVISEFAPAEGEWIRFHIGRSWSDNRAFVKWRLKGRSIALAAIILEPQTPHWPLRALGLSIAPWRMLAYSETGQHFRIRPDNALVMLRYLAWRGKNLVRSQIREGGWLHDSLATFVGSRQRELAWLYWRARVHPLFADAPPKTEPWPKRRLAPGISVIIPSRNGRELLASCLPRLEGADEIIIVDNGSEDGTAEFLNRTHPAVVVESRREPLSFAEAVNRGLSRAQFSHVCLLNNDMLVEPGFLAALRRPFDHVPELFSASAQIFLPEGVRREETGKTVWNPSRATTDFPVSCDVPLEGEDLSYVLYGSGGCTLYDAAKLAELGGLDPGYETAYVEDLDIGYRAWRRGWPSVYCGGARVLHQHRATTSRYFTAGELDTLLERNFLRFLGTIGGSPANIWRENLRRLRSGGKIAALQATASVPISRGAASDEFLPLVTGDVAIFPGKAQSARSAVVVVSPYLPFPLSHGAAVRIYNLTKRAAEQFDLVLVSFVEELAPVPIELTRVFTEIVTVRRPGTHAIPSTDRPDTVEEFDSPAFHAALRQTVTKWKPRIVQLEFTQMAQYAGDAASARTILVEHDITYDLFAQMLAHEEDWENRRQYERWLRFEKSAWRSVDRVVTMSEKDRQSVPGAVALPNGVDLDRFRPSQRPPERRRLLFIGSFAHAPNVLGLQFFLREVFPLLKDVTLQVIAGQRHQQFWDLHQENVEVEGFVADVRPAYERAAVVIAPLVASAGTNIKILEAMAMGKAIVSTEAGINGLDLASSGDLIVANDPREMASAIERLLDFPAERLKLEAQARRTVESRYGWDAIASGQQRLYESLI